VSSYESAAVETYPKVAMASHDGAIPKPLYPDLRQHGYLEKQPGKLPQLTRDWW
jgi:hypothetical protein